MTACSWPYSISTLLPLSQRPYAGPSGGAFLSDSFSILASPCIGSGEAMPAAFVRSMDVHSERKYLIRIPSNRRVRKWT